MQVNRGEDAVVVAIEEQVMDIEPQVQKRIGALWSLANIATLFGLLGTILGLIHTFGALDRVADPGRRQQLLARGISEAMNNTALGLGIADLGGGDQATDGRERDLECLVDRGGLLADAAGGHLKVLVF